MPMTDDQAAEGKKALETAESNAGLMEAGDHRSRRRAPSPSWGRRAAAMART